MSNRANAFLSALTLAAELASYVQQIQPLHDEARFNALLTDAEQFAATIESMFLGNDPVATAFVGALTAFIEKLRSDGWAALQARAAAAAGTPAPTTPTAPTPTQIPKPENA